MGFVTLNSINKYFIFINTIERMPFFIHIDIIFSISNYYKLYNKRRTKIIEQKAGKRMMSKLYKIKDKNNSSDNNSFKIGLVREV